MTINDKASIRTEMRQIRRQLSLTDKGTAAIVDGFFDDVFPTQDQILAFYWPVGGECDARILMHESLQRGYKCCLPVVRNDTRILTFAVYDALEPLKEGAYGESVPVNSEIVIPDVIVMPLIAFDRHGNRLGQGGGYYDASLAHYRMQKRLVAIGLAYTQQEWLNSDLPIDGHDQKLDWVITPDGARKF